MISKFHEIPKTIKFFVYVLSFSFSNTVKQNEVNLNGARILDLFSGSGSFGLECLSRGVNEVIFVENYLGVFQIIKKNLANLKTIENYSIIEEDIFNENFLSNLKKRVFRNIKKTR